MPGNQAREMRVLLVNSSKTKTVNISSSQASNPSRGTHPAKQIKRYKITRHIFSTQVVTAIRP